VARLFVIVGVLAVIPAFFLPGTYPMNPRLDPRIWYVVGGDWLGIGIVFITLGILVSTLTRRFHFRNAPRVRLGTGNQRPLAEPPA
jgi:hypothetical protein